MYFLTGKVLARGQFILNLACFLIAFIGDDIRYCANVVFTAGTDNYWGRSKSGSTSEQFDVWTSSFKE